METKFDIIIIGAGPNGLQAGAYLSKAGERFLCWNGAMKPVAGYGPKRLPFPDFFTVLTLST